MKLNIRLQGLLLFAVLIFFDCSKSPEVLFKVESEFDRNIDGGLNLTQTHFFPLNNIPTFWSSFQMNSGYSEDVIGKIFPDKATITSKFGENLDFIHSVTIWVYDTNYDEGEEIFYLENIDFGNKTEIKLLSGITDVADWIKDENMLIEIRLNLRQTKATVTELRMNLDFAVFEKE